MLPIAANSLMSRLESVPHKVWLWLGAAVLGLIVLVFVVRNIAKMNKVILSVIVFLVLTFVGFNWIYERNEPSWATPVVEKLAGFFPSKGTLK